MNTLYEIALTKIKGIGPKLTKALIARFGDAESIFNASHAQLATIVGTHSTIIPDLKSKSIIDQALRELEFIQKNRIQTFWIGNENYPRRLLHCEDAPMLLYYKGNADLNSSKIISIVGSRNATSYGLDLCKELISGMKETNTVIISGLAYGIDVQAHKVSIEHNIPTVGVLAHGLDRIYPEIHRPIAKKMLENGGLLTEFPTNTKPIRPNFPMRNRIVAGLSDVTIVVEAALKGGALITAEIANSYNRDVCAYPGAIGAKYSEGCNYLIKTNRAHLIRNVEDLYYLMNWEKENIQKKSAQLPLFPTQLNEEETLVYSFLQEKKNAHIDEIAIHCQWPQSKLAITLLEMELAGHLSALPGKVFKINP